MSSALLHSHFRFSIRSTRTTLESIDGSGWSEHFHKTLSVFSHGNSCDACRRLCAEIAKRCHAGTPGGESTFNAQCKDSVTNICSLHPSNVGNTHVHSVSTGAQTRRTYPHLLPCGWRWLHNRKVNMENYSSSLPSLYLFPRTILSVVCHCFRHVSPVNLQKPQTQIVRAPNEFVSPCGRWIVYSFVRQHSRPHCSQATSCEFDPESGCPFIYTETSAVCLSSTFSEIS